MKLSIAMSAVALFALVLPAAADTAASVKTKSGKTVWDVTSVEKLEGTNNGGKGKTDKTAPGLLNAAGNGGLAVEIKE